MSHDIIEFKISITIQHEDYYSETITDHRPQTQHKYLVVKTKSLLTELQKMKIESPEYFKEFLSCSGCLRELLDLLFSHKSLIPNFAFWPSYRKLKDFEDDK